MPASGLLSIELSPPAFVTIPGAAVILEEWECKHGDGKGLPWQVKEYYAQDELGARHGLGMHTWSHMDAPLHSIPAGLAIGQLDPSWYSALRTQVIDLTRSTAAERRHTQDDVEFHSQITVDDLPSDADLDDASAIAFITGYSALLPTKAQQRTGSDAHWPHITKAAAEKIASFKNITAVLMDAPSVDTVQSVNVAHRALLGRGTKPVLICESLMLNRLLDPLFSGRKYTNAEALITIGLAPGNRGNADGSWITPTAYVPDPQSELGTAAYERFRSLLVGATVVRV